MKYDFKTELGVIRDGIREHSAVTPPYKLDECRKAHTYLWFRWEGLYADIRDNRPQYVAAHGEPVVQSAEQELAAIHAQLMAFGADHGTDTVGAQIRDKLTRELRDGGYLGF